MVWRVSGFCKAEIAPSYGCTWRKGFWKIYSEFSTLWTLFGYLFARGRVKVVTQKGAQI